MLVRYKRNKKVAYYCSESLATAGRPETIRRPRGPFESCGECNYAAHGFICYTAEGDCLKTDMQRIEGRRKTAKEVQSN